MSPAVAPPSFPESLSAAIAARGVTLRELVDSLGARGHSVSLSTLSSWRSGRRRPDGAASREVVEALEDVLDLAESTLSSLLGPSRRPGPRDTTPYSVGGAEATAEALRALGMSDPHALVESSSHVVLDVDLTGRVTRLTVRAAWLARTPGAHHAPYFVAVDTPAASSSSTAEAAVATPHTADATDGVAPALEPPTIRAVAGCTIGATHHRADTGLFAAELRLHRPLETNETVITEIELGGMLGGPDEPGWDLMVTRRQRVLALWVRFDPRRVPRTIHAITHDARGSVRRRVAAIGPEAHLLQPGFGPGTAGLRWEW